MALKKDVFLSKMAFLRDIFELVSKEGDLFGCMLAYE
jgi:hypothetical protein